MSNRTLVERLQDVRERIGSAAQRAGRPPENVRLIAVSKTVSEQQVEAAVEAGQLAFGENRVQELTRKAGLLPKKIEWHLIGHLQRNKAGPALTAATWIHSLDSVDLAERLERLAAQAQMLPNVLIQVNTTHEVSKEGVPPDDAEELLTRTLACPHLRCRGLMTIARFGAAEAELRRSFADLRTLRDRLETCTGAALPDLSMGMSGDFEDAIMEGATMVRVGSAIFGPRQG